MSDRVNNGGAAGGVINNGVINDSVINGGGTDNGVFLIPQTVFVGDQGRLVVPLSEAVLLSTKTGAQTTMVITDRLPFNDNIMVKRVTVDPQARQLLIDFMAFKPGTVDIPEIPTVVLPPLTITIASILERDGYSVTLSPPEEPLAAPGTFALIIGGAAAFIALVILAVFFVLYGPKHFQRLFEKIRVRWLLYKAKRAIRAAQNALAAGRVEAKEGVAAVSEAARDFLSALYRKNYASYAAADFLTDAAFADGTAYRIFADCDRLRFSPAQTGREAVAAVAEKTISYIEGFVNFVNIEDRARFAPTEGFAA